MKINEIVPDELMDRLSRNGDELVVVDMRREWEYQAGHIQSAIHMFVQDIPDRFEELPQDKDVVFQCWHGNTSLDASAFLIQNGWNAERVYSLSGGMAGWANRYGINSLQKTD
jgi:rhodanese-related sulfurtransferase